MSPRLPVGAEDVCAAVEATLVEHLPDWLPHVGLDPVTEWLQLPTPDAITQRADYPAGAIVSPGLVDAPSRRGGGYDATWRVVVAMYDRGQDYNDTQRLARTWASALRTVLLLHPGLDGLAASLTWVGEEYALIAAPSAAQTLGACSVSLDVAVRDVVPDGVPGPPGHPAGPPLATSTRSTVTVRP